MHPRDIAFFQADNKIVFIITPDGTRYIHNQKNGHLEEILDPRYFFRINRSVIVNTQAIEHVKPHINSRLKIILRSGLSSGEFIVSRDRMSAFRNWAHC
ncbi:LytTR family DNA-binding domain-containing protein [Flavihumibacter sp. ZG627]|uniref:LytTR family DNA-binding domain-containing protein n=1 Tax=Flavihumibacter sp. ZG627 TaxID=1463156 RepID=UPI00155B0208